MSLYISQAEADALIAINKIRPTDEEYKYPNIGESVRIPLISEDRREEFMLDISRSGKIDKISSRIKMTSRKM